MVDKSFLHGSFLLFLGVVLGLTVSTLSSGPVPVEGLIFTSGSAHMGVSDVNMSVNVYGYNLTFYNSGEDVIYVNTIEPVLSTDPRILSSQNSVVRNVNSYVPAGSVIYAEGSIELDSTNLSKAELMDIQPILFVNVTSTQIIRCFDYPNGTDA